MRTRIVEIMAIVGLVFIGFVILAYSDSITSKASISSDSMQDTVLLANGVQDTHEIVIPSSELPQVVKAVKLRKEFYWAGERIPIENFDVKERLVKELTVNSYYHSSTTQALLRSGRYFDLMKNILIEEGVPTDFIYLSVAESNLENATSPAGAKGFWQFMPITGKHYGLEISKTVDERYNLEKATRAACKLLKDYKERFGTWVMAAAAYNAGETRIARNIVSQNAETYYDLNLNSETSRYVFRLVALKEIMSDPHRFGFYIEEDDKFDLLPPYKTVEVSSSISSLGDFAEEQGISYRMLKVYNPWLVESSLYVRPGNKYEVRIPM